MMVITFTKLDNYNFIQIIRHLEGHYLSLKVIFKKYP